MAPPPKEQRLDAVFRALCDSTRRDILARLSAGEATVRELAEPYAMTAQAVSRHLQVLEQSGLVTRRRQQQSRPCRLEPGALDEAVVWIEQSRRTWPRPIEQLGTDWAGPQPEEST